MDPNPEAFGEATGPEETRAAVQRVRLGQGAEERPGAPTESDRRDELRAETARADDRPRERAASAEPPTRFGSLADELRRLAMSLSMLALALDGLDALLHRAGEGAGQPGRAVAEAWRPPAREPPVAGEETTDIQTLLRRYLGG